MNPLASEALHAHLSVSVKDNATGKDGMSSFDIAEEPGYVLVRGVKHIEGLQVIDELVCKLIACLFKPLGVLVNQHHRLVLLHPTLHYAQESVHVTIERILHTVGTPKGIAE